MNWKKSTFSDSGTECVELGWKKSSFSGIGNDCVEVGWKKSSFSDGFPAGCVELHSDLAGVGDTKTNGSARMILPQSAVRGLVKFAASAAVVAGILGIGGGILSATSSAADSREAAPGCYGCIEIAPVSADGRCRDGQNWLNC